ncbi:hypothetical protein [Streptomyces sp. MMBL 11-1]|uniref:hypothetical protein n=1 Tax=Streptomyces sp. MMBL 11-1 TaxID=3026420 RepID=UPI0023624902|nr:hypothetical protein [Streptomyces sp. MMBL 11-1]
MTLSIDPAQFPTMTVFTLEVFDTFTAETVGFYPITAPDIEYVEGLAADLLVAMNYGRATALDWRQITEHPYNPAAPDVFKARPFVDKIGAKA